MMDMMLKYRMLSEHPQAQAEAIARHYLAHTNLALDLLNIIEVKRLAPTGAGTTSSDDAIRYLVDEIKEGHARDLGIQLDWPNEKIFRELEDSDPEKIPAVAGPLQRLRSVCEKVGINCTFSLSPGFNLGEEAVVDVVAKALEGFLEERDERARQDKEIIAECKAKLSEDGSEDFTGGISAETIKHLCAVLSKKKDDFDDNPFVGAVSDYKSVKKSDFDAPSYSGFSYENEK